MIFPIFPAVRRTTALLGLGLLALSFAISGCKSEAGESAAQPASVSASEGVNPELVEKLTQTFAAARSDLEVVDVQSTQIEGIYEVFFDGKGSVYAAGDSGYFFVGELYQIDDQKLVNVKQQRSNGPRKEMLAGVNRDDMIIFSPEGEVKASVTVFTDVDCGYCRKLHNEVPAMNALGIEVKYMAFPRAGIGSLSFQKIASAWCADDPQEALTELKNGKSLPIEVCEGNPVAAQYRLGGRLGVTGTPALVLESGELVPGYVTAKELARTLGI